MKEIKRTEMKEEATRGKGKTLKNKELGNERERARGKALTRN